MMEDGGVDFVGSILKMLQEEWMAFIFLFLIGWFYLQGIGAFGVGKGSGDFGDFANYT